MCASTTIFYMSSSQHHHYTGCGAGHRWCEAVFTHKGDHVHAIIIFMEDNKISVKCSNWDNAERGIKNLQAGMKITGDAVDIFIKLAAVAALA